MEKVIISFFETNKLKLKNQTIVIAVSTGIDSMAMLAAFNNLKKEYNLNLWVVHVNHQVRDQSVIEEEFICNYARENNLEIRTFHLEVKEGVNFQSFARSKRYEFFFDVMLEAKGNYLVLAHHANDNMETIMMRLLRGSNLRGYAGIVPVIERDNFKIIRPFINTLKEDIIKYVEANNIKYFEDYTNKEDIYTRNRIRRELIPIIFKEEKNAEQKFSEFSKAILDASLVIGEKVKSIISEFTHHKSLVCFNKDIFLSYNQFIQEEVLFTLLEKYDLSKANIIEIINLIKANKQNIKVEFKNSFTFVKEYGKISILYYLVKPLDVDCLIEEVKTYNINDTIEINVAKSSSNFIPSENELWYNSTMLPVRIRSRKPGDKILLEGGYKKVKDLLIDLKIGILKRENVLIMEKDDNILAVIGIRKSVKLKKIEKNDIVINVRFKDNG